MYSKPQIKDILRKFARVSIGYPDDMEIPPCKPSVLSDEVCPIFDREMEPLFDDTRNPKLPDEVVQETIDLMDIKGIRLDKKRILNKTDDICNLGPEINSILNHFSPREIAERLPQLSKDIYRTSTQEREKIVDLIERAVKEDNRKTSLTVWINIFYILILLSALLFIIIVKDSQYKIHETKLPPGLVNPYGFLILNIWIAFSVFYYHAKYALRVSNLTTFYLISAFHIVSVSMFILFLQTGETAYSAMSFVSMIFVSFFILSTVMKLRGVPLLGWAVTDYPNLFKECEAVQTNQQTVGTSNDTSNETIQVLLLSFLPSVYQTYMYMRLT